MSEPSQDGEQEHTKSNRRHRKRAQWLIGGTAAIVVLGIAAALVWSRMITESEAAPPPAPDVATATIRTADLAKREKERGTIGYGPSRPITAGREATLTDLPVTGDVLERGEPVYEVDAQPVPLFYGDIPLYRPITQDIEGDDVRMVEENLAALGFGGFGTPDTVATWATERAIRNWQDSLGLEETGEIKPGDIVVEPDAVRVTKVSAKLGDQATGTVMRVSGTQRLVTVELSLDERHMANPDEKVDIELPDGTTVAGTITSVQPQSSSGGEKEGGPGAGAGGDPKVEVLITLKGDKAAEAQNHLPVSVMFTTETRQDVLVVPVGALVALREGGYAVEVVAGKDRRLVKVEPGLFANGRVEITGDGLLMGMTVVTTS